jgi:hypothetical protein
VSDNVEEHFSEFPFRRFSIIPKAQTDKRILPNEYAGNSAAERPEVKSRMKFLFEKFRAAVGVANVFAGITTSFELQAYRTTLKCGANSADALPMRVVQAFRDANQRGQPAGKSAIAVVECAVRNVMAFRLGFAIVVTDDGSRERAVAPIQSRYVAIHC